MNSDYLFFWHDQKVAKLDLCSDWMTCEPQELNISIHNDQHSKGCRIDNIRCGSNSDNIAIIMERAYDKGYSVVSWSVEADHEFGSFDVQAPYFIAFDSNGHIYSVHSGQVAF